MINEWKQRLNEADDDYLIGLSNKGIVKRAYKDLEAQNTDGSNNILIQEQEIRETVSMPIGEETVTLCFPLGESKCSCPARGVCRHIVMAILALKKQFQDTQDKSSDNEEQKVQEQHSAENQKESAIWEEIAAASFDSLKKILGKRKLSQFAAQVSDNDAPELIETSIVTVHLRQGETVKLLSPLEYSACTCHKKELCAHKAEAILWCQVKKGILTKERVQELLNEDTTLEKQEVHLAARQMKSYLQELLDTGLARVSPEVTNSLERLAVISHNAQLANFEGYFRALAKTYQSYLKRESSFSILSLMQQISRLYQRVDQLLQTEDTRELARLAGAFKADYMYAGKLDLIGITTEQFESKSGYEGITVYFLERNTKKWYTFTNARPIFYENMGGTKPSPKSEAPWGILAPLERMSELCIELKHAKIDNRYRLSSSQDTIGTIVGERKLEKKDLEGWYYSDFKELFFQYVVRQQRAWISEKEENEAIGLVFLQPARCSKAEFSITHQLFSLILYDEADREVWVAIQYSNKEAESIRYLEKLVEGIEAGKVKLPCFLGKVFLYKEKSGAKIRMYPIALFDNIV